MASISDKFGRASLPTSASVATTVKATRTAGVLVLEAHDLSKFATDTPVFFVTYKKYTDPTTGAVSAVNVASWKALVNPDTNTLTNLTIQPGFTDTGNNVGDFIECIPTSAWENSLIDGLLVLHTGAGQLKDKAVTLAKLDGGSTAGVLATDTSGNVKLATAQSPTPFSGGQNFLGNTLVTIPQGITGVLVTYVYCRSTDVGDNIVSLSLSGTGATEIFPARMVLTGQYQSSSACGIYSVSSTHASPFIITASQTTTSDQQRQGFFFIPSGVGA